MVSIQLNNNKMEYFFLNDVLIVDSSINIVNLKASRSVHKFLNSFKIFVYVCVLRHDHKT